ncbi:hypothetical protein [Halorubrum tebenquichense]|uniref:Uncharacterized protein n=1 Tax=Halorubrum tebenquichense DSM 14210 TaxID=1227485 RepID=M0DMT1_9EURY|nr:hypothetical protein [Halorubrum tebenquichense]ELZ36795.1 hypothetical protein C472_09543 [Halorubrum tebenquichense DSM 14210]
MTASNPIPLDEFATAVESLDRDALATLVGETYAATADGATVDPPRVTVSDGDRRTEIHVVAAADEPLPDGSVDAVAVAGGSRESLDGEPLGDAVEVVTPGDLRERLLYAAPPADANALAERVLGVPVRSTEYDDVAAAGSTADGSTAGGSTGDEAADGTTVDGVASGTTADNPADETMTTAGGTTDEATVGGVRTAGAAAGDATRRDGPGPRPRSPSRTDAGEPADAATERTYPRTLLAAVAVVALLAAGVGGALVGTAVGSDGLDGFAGVGGGESTEPSPTGSDAVGPGGAAGGGGGTGDSDGDDGGSVDGVDGEPTDGPTDEVARNTAAVPTCERSALQVVQIQLNALRYDDNATNDGVRTLRAFASPENRATVGSVDDYAALFETERYAPMRTYDTAAYSVPAVDGGTAEVEVVTREGGDVTGRYAFRLELIDGGSQGTDDALGDVDGCWMTDSVAASTE